MERNDFPFQLPFQLGSPRPDPSPAALRLAAALAERLDVVVPPPFRVSAEGRWVSLYEGDRWDGSSDVASALDQEIDPDAAEGAEGSFAWRAAMVAESLLSRVQDGVAEATTEPWPRLAHGGMAFSGTRTDGDQVLLWYGPAYDREAGAVVVFPPIRVKALLDTE
jgi:hypothetical protein